jgi:hypothetical protein
MMLSSLALPGLVQVCSIVCESAVQLYFQRTRTSLTLALLFTKAVRFLISDECIPVRMYISGRFQSYPKQRQ